VSGRWRRLGPLAVVLLVAVTIPAVTSLTGLADKRDRTYETRSLESKHQLDLAYDDDYQYEATFEKCEIQSIDSLATALGVPARPTPVARAYARHHAPAVRTAVFHGCRDAYLKRWHPPSAPAVPTPNS
jgi:hypothetical protein